MGTVINVLLFIGLMVIVAVTLLGVVFGLFYIAMVIDRIVTKWMLK